jgi:hypothetical protein
MTAARWALAAWLLACGCTHVAIERTGDYGKAVFNSLESPCAVIWLTAQHVKAVPGRQTDVNDAARLAALLQPGRLRASLLPPAAQRERRGLARYRCAFLQARGPLIHRVPKLLEDATSELAAVASALMGVAGRAILAALLTEHVAPRGLAELATGRLRSTRDQ